MEYRGIVIKRLIAMLIERLKTMLNETFNNNVYFKHLLKTFTKSEKY